MLDGSNTSCSSQSAVNVNNRYSTVYCVAKLWCLVGKVYLVHFNLKYFQFAIGYWDAIPSLVKNNLSRPLQHIYSPYIRMIGICHCDTVFQYSSPIPSHNLRVTFLSFVKPWDRDAVDSVSQHLILANVLLSDISHWALGRAVCSFILSYLSQNLDPRSSISSLLFVGHYSFKNHAI